MVLQRLKTMKKFKTVNPNSDRARLSEMVIYESFEGEDFNWKILVFWIGGRLWKLVAYDRWSHMEVRLYPREGLLYKNDRDSRRLALECKLQILVSLKVFGMESYYICPFRYRLGLRIKKFTKNALTLTTQKSTSGVSLSLSHTCFGLPWGFNLNFPASITVTFIGKYAQGLYQIVLLKTFLQLPKSPVSVVSVVIPKLLRNHFGVKTANKKRKVFLINDG